METVAKKNFISQAIVKNNNVLHANIILRRKNSHTANITRKIRYQHDKTLRKLCRHRLHNAWYWLVKIYFCFVLYYCAYLKKTRWISSWWWGKGRGWARISWTRFQNFLFDFTILEYKTACLCLSFSLQSMEVIPVFVLFISYNLRVMDCSVGNAPDFKGGLWVQIQTYKKKSVNAMHGSGQHSFLSSFFYSQKWQIFDFHTSSKI